jgi:hypothetical protein
MLSSYLKNQIFTPVSSSKIVMSIFYELQVSTCILQSFKINSTKINQTFVYFRKTTSDGIELRVGEKRWENRASKDNRYDDVLFHSCSDTFTKTEYERGKKHLTRHNRASFFIAQKFGRITGIVCPISSETTMISAFYLHHLDIIASVHLLGGT